MTDLESSVDRISEETRFSGVVRVDRGDDVLLCKAYGFAHRWGIANTIDTRFATASGTKGLTALTVMSLIEEGRLELDTTARSVLGDDLPLIEDAVTVEHLLAHRSGIGDYFDEEIERPKDAYILPTPVHELATTEPYVRVLDGFPTKFPPGERFSYSNSGYVILALLAERVSGIPFHDLVVQRGCEPAGMVDSTFLRSDDLPERTALGYLDPNGHRTQRLPPRGPGHRRRRHLHDRSRHAYLLEGPVRRADRSHRHPYRVAASTQRRGRRPSWSVRARGSRSSTWWSCTAGTLACPFRPTTVPNDVSRPQ